MKHTMRYNIEHTNSTELRAMIESAGGDVVSDVNPCTSDGTGIAVVEFPVDQMEYVDSMLENSVSIIVYR